MKKYVLIIIVSLISVTLIGCGFSEENTLTNEEVVDAFTEAGLDIGETREMTEDDYGLGPMKAEEGTRFLITSLGDDNGGRILTYKNESDLDEMKEYYDSMSEEADMLFSWTMKHKNVLVQINGALPEEDYNEYKSALEGL